MLRNDKQVGFVAHDLSVFICTAGGAYEAGGVAAGDPGNEIKKACDGGAEMRSDQTETAR
jgi:hypothetical protein